MGAQVSVLLDKRRSKKGGLYPLKLRVYDEGQTVTFLMVYDMAEEDYERLSAKRLTEGLEKTRDAIRETELKAMDIARKLKPFDFEAFYISFIIGNPHFVQNKKVFSKTKPEVKARQEEVPAEWKRKFSIFDEPYNGPEYISSIYLLIITSLLHQARVGSARSYQTSFASFKDFRGDVKISEVTSRYLKEFEGWMIVEKGNSKTTVGIYARSMRAVVNEAIELKLLARDDYPFGRRRYGIPTGRNIKKALDKPTLSKLYHSETTTESQQRARDFWFFSFYGNGMNVKDIIHLKYKNIQGEYLVFERAKTELTTRGGEPIMISCYINEDMLNIIAKWGNKDKHPDNYIFPILSPGLSPIRQFEIKQAFTQYLNKNMAKVSEAAKIEKKVRTMETRHSSSTLMKNAGVSAHYIKESLGHTSLKTTENYLAGFENDQKKEYAKILDTFKDIDKTI